MRGGGGLRIAVMGPGLNDPDDPGARKRRQIRTALEHDGHSPFFPEEYVDSDPPFISLLEQELLILSGSDVDLVIFLHTSTSFGVATELGFFVRYPEIKAKSAVLFPIQFYTPDESLVANTARAYFVKMPYSGDHLDTCQLVSECRKWANDRATGNWQVTTPHQF